MGQGATPEGTERYAQTFKEIAAGYDGSERAALFHDTAARVYNL